MPTDPPNSSGRQTQSTLHMQESIDNNAPTPPPPTRKRKPDLNKFKGTIS